MTETNSPFAALQRRLYDVPEPDRHDYVHAIRAMQSELSPEIVCALLDVAEAAKVIYDIDSFTESVKVAEAKLMLQAPFRKLGLIGE